MAAQVKWSSGSSAIVSLPPGEQDANKMIDVSANAVFVRAIELPVSILIPRSATVLGARQTHGRARVLNVRNGSKADISGPSANSPELAV
jgi:hypothetical protein